MRGLHNHDVMIAILERSLDVEYLQLKNVEWPKDDYARKQYIATLMDVQHSSISSKRSRSYFGKEDSQKRSRTD